LAARAAALAAENARLRGQLAEQSERMQAASIRLRAAATNIPHDPAPAVAEVSP